MAATHGVYKREKTSIDAAVTAETDSTIEDENKTCIDETTVSFAIIPLINDVIIRQSSRPIGLKSGETNPAIIAIILFEESST